MKIVIALGGNAILRKEGGGSASDQLDAIRDTCKQLVRILGAGHHILITHGNGPQVGDILLAGEMAKKAVAPMPLDVCGAETQGMIGYMIQQSLDNELSASRLMRPVVTVVTQTVVDPADPAFAEPTKPVGPYYGAGEARRLRREKGWVIATDGESGYRRLVPSPTPVDIVESALLRRLFRTRTVLVAAGGGGVPVVRDAAGRLRGIEAVIDKDMTAAHLARLLQVDVLMMLTDVEGVYLNHGRRGQKLLHRMSREEARRYQGRGQFPPGSMGPKVEAALRFVESGGKEAIITSLNKAEAALEGKAGTHVTR